MMGKCLSKYFDFVRVTVPGGHYLPQSIQLPQPSKSRQVPAALGSNKPWTPGDSFLQLVSSNTAAFKLLELTPGSVPASSCAQALRR